MIQPEESLLAASCQRKGFHNWHLITDYLERISLIKDQQIHQELLAEMVGKYVALEQTVDILLKNTLPPQVAEELKYTGHFLPREYDCTIIFADVAGFTTLAEKLAAEELISILDQIFSQFDLLIRLRGGTKIKTIGDSYMAVFGAPQPDHNHPDSAVRAAIDLLDYMAVFNPGYFAAAPGNYFNFRIGIHSGTVMAGVVGQERIQFDIFGDNVNIASRFESAGEPGRINISEATCLRLPPGYVFEDRGLLPLKKKGAMKAYFVAAAAKEPEG